MNESAQIIGSIAPLLDTHDTIHQSVLVTLVDEKAATSARLVFDVTSKTATISGPGAECSALLQRASKLTRRAGYRFVYGGSVDR